MEVKRVEEVPFPFIIEENKIHGMPESSRGDRWVVSQKLAEAVETGEFELPVLQEGRKPSLFVSAKMPKTFKQEGG